MNAMERAYKQYSSAVLFWGGAVLSATNLGCDSTEVQSADCAATAHEYVLAVVATSDDVVGFTLWGKPLSDVPTDFLPFGAVRLVSPPDDASPPTSVTVGFSADPAMPAPSTVTYSMPLTSKVGGVMAVSTEGISWLHFENPVNDTILHLTLIDANGDEAQPFQAGQSGQLIYPLEPGAEMFLVGLPTSDYKKLRLQTAKGLLVELDL